MRAVVKATASNVFAPRRTARHKSASRTGCCKSLSFLSASLMLYAWTSQNALEAVQPDPCLIVEHRERSDAGLDRRLIDRPAATGPSLPKAHPRGCRDFSQQLILRPTVMTPSLAFSLGGE